MPLRSKYQKNKALELQAGKKKEKSAFLMKIQNQKAHIVWAFRAISVAAF